MRKLYAVKHGDQVMDIAKIFKRNLNVQFSGMVDDPVQSVVAEPVDRVCVIRQVDHHCRNMMLMAVIDTFQIIAEQMFSLQIV